MLALKADGTVASWGRSNFGLTPVPPDLTNVVALASGDRFSFALEGDGPLVTRVLLTNLTRTATTSALLVPTCSGKVYALEYKNSLGDPNWTGLPLVAGTGTNVMLTDIAAINFQRFYGVKQW